MREETLGRAGKGFRLVLGWQARSAEAKESRSRFSQQIPALARKTEEPTDWLVHRSGGAIDTNPRLAQWPIIHLSFPVFRNATRASRPWLVSASNAGLAKFTPSSARTARARARFSASQAARSWPMRAA